MQAHNQSSKDFKMSLTKPREGHYLENFVSMEIQKMVILATDGEPVCSANPKVTEALIDSVAKWMYYVGIKTPDTADLLSICDIIKKHYSKLTVLEVSAVSELLLTGELGIDPKTYGSFSPLYVCSCINEYLKYKQLVFRHAMERKERKEIALKPSPTMSAAEQCELMRTLIRTDFELWREKGYVHNPLSMVYDYFVKHGKIVTTPEQEKAAMEAGQIAFNKFMMLQRNANTTKGRPEFEGLQEYLSDYGRSSRKMKYAGDHLVMEYFKKYTLEAILSEVVESQFT